MKVTKRNSEGRGRTFREKKIDVSMVTSIIGPLTIFNVGTPGARTNHGKIEEEVTVALWLETLFRVCPSPLTQVASPQVRSGL